MTTFQHLINNRTLNTYHPIEQELPLHAEKNYLFDLSYVGVLDVGGDKALEFLQGQLTCDVHSVSDIQIAQGAQCNLQGRILALMDVIYWQGVKLVLPQDLMEQCIKSLNKTAMLSRVTLQKNQGLCILGFYLQNKHDLLPETTFLPDTLYGLSYSTEYCAYHLGAGFYIFIAQAEFAKKITQLFTQQDQMRGSLTWHTMRLEKNQIDIYPESKALFLPHRLDLQQTPYLSFNKGCYKGQEIIARMHYKAVIKHQLKIYSIITDKAIYSGQKLMKVNGETELGEVIDYSLLATGHYLIAVSILKESESVALLDGHEQPVQLCVAD